MAEISSVLNKMSSRTGSRPRPNSPEISNFIKRDNALGYLNLTILDKNKCYKNKNLFILKNIRLKFSNNSLTRCVPIVPLYIGEPLTIEQGERKKSLSLQIMVL